jgi:hypothetical protein
VDSHTDSKTFESAAPALPPRSIALLTPALGTKNIGDHFIELAIRRMLRPDTVYERFTIRRALRADEIDRINQTSCALICGTNLYQHDWESALDVSVLKKITVPIIPFGVGSSAASLTDTYVGDATRTMVRRIHEHCAVGSVRDPHSAAVLTRAGVTNFIMTGCPVLFWAGEDHRLPPVAAGPRKRLVVTARNWLMHRWPDNIDHPVQIDLLRRVLAEFPREVITFAVHEDFDRNLIEKLNIPAEQVLDTQDPQDYVRLYSDPDHAVLALRLHAGMLARANGLPAIFVGHDTRTYAFCNMMGIECIDMFDERCGDKVIDRLTLALAGEPVEGDAIAKADEIFPRLSDAMADFIAANDLPGRLPTAAKSTS